MPNENRDSNVSGERYVEDRDVTEMIFKTSGRLNRMRYIKRLLAVSVVEGAIYMTAFFLFSDDWGRLSGFGSVVTTVLLFAGQLPVYCLNVRRLHDMNKGDTFATVLLICGFIGLGSSSDVLSLSALEKISYSVVVLSRAPMAQINTERILSARERRAL